MLIHPFTKLFLYMQAFYGNVSMLKYMSTDIIQMHVLCINAWYICLYVCVNAFFKFAYDVTSETSIYGHESLY